MSCSERGCVFPVANGGYCQSHAWKMTGAALPGLSMSSSLGSGAPRATGAAIQAKPVVPVIRLHTEAKKSQTEKVLAALVAGAATSAECAAMTGLAANTCSAVLSILGSKSKAHKVSINPDRRQATWALGPLPKTPPETPTETQVASQQIEASVDIPTAAPVVPEVPPAEIVSIAEEYLRAPVEFGLIGRLPMIAIQEEGRLIDLSIRLVEESPEKPETWEAFMSLVKRVQKIRELIHLARKVQDAIETLSKDLRPVSS